MSDLVERLRGLASNGIYTVYNSLSELFRDARTAADTIEALTAERDRLRDEVTRLKRPNLFWIDEDPESGYHDPWEATESALYNSDDEGVAAIREGRELGVRYYARLRADDEIGIDEDWLKDFDTSSEADAAIADERKRRDDLRAALNGEPS